MEFYDLDLTMFNITNMPVKDCRHEFNSGVTIVINVIGIIYTLIRVCGWCRDPLAVDLQKRIKELEDENAELSDQSDDLSNKLDELKDDYKFISERLRRANESLDNLRDVLDIVRPVDDVSADTQG